MTSRHHPAVTCAAALDLLGLPAHATQAQIAHAYRQLAKATHPDTGDSTDPGAGERFASVHEAYQVLAEAQPAAAKPPPGADTPSVIPQRGPGTSWVTAGVESRRPPLVAGPVTVTAPARNHRANLQRPT